MCTRAIANGANSLAEGFLFVVAASIIVAETWRSSRSEGKRRDIVNDNIDELSDKIEALTRKLEAYEGRIVEDEQRQVPSCTYPDLYADSTRAGVRIWRRYYLD